MSKAQVGLVGLTLPQLLQQQHASAATARTRAPLPTSMRWFVEPGSGRDERARHAAGGRRDRDREALVPRQRARHGAAAHPVVGDLAPAEALFDFDDLVRAQRLTLSLIVFADI